MPSVLQILLTGLCEFVPKYDIADPSHSGKNQMRVLMADTSHHMDHMEEDHVPVLLCPLADVDRSPGNRTEDETFVYQNQAYAIFYLQDQDLRIDGAAAEALTVPNYGGGGPGCATTANYRDFAWVAALETVTPGSGAVKNACLASSGAVDPSVAARAALSAGTIETYRIARDESGQIMSWAFEPRRAIQQSIADVVKFSSNLATASATFKTSLFRQARDERVAALYPQGVAERPIVVLPELDLVLAYVLNMPMPDIRHTRRPPTRRRSPETHFVHFYDMSNNPGTRNIPFQVDVCPEQAGPHQGNPSCPPARSAANPSA